MKNLAPVIMRQYKAAAIAGLALGTSFVPFDALAQVAKPIGKPLLKPGGRQRGKGTISPVGGDPETADFSDIGYNITASVEHLPGLLTGLAYMMALGLGIQAVMKLKEHVEEPDKIPLKASAIRLFAGGALLALPIVFEAMNMTVGTTGAEIAAAPVSRVAFHVDP